MKDAFEVLSVVEGLEYKDWRFFVGPMGDGFYLQLQWWDEDNFNPGERYKNHGRKWYLSRHMTDSEIVLTAWAAVEFAEIHEAREKFKYNGAVVFNPHVAVSALVDIAREGKTEVRA